YEVIVQYCDDKMQYNDVTVQYIEYDVTVQYFDVIMHYEDVLMQCYGAMVPYYDLSHLGLYMTRWQTEAPQHIRGPCYRIKCTKVADSVNIRLTLIHSSAEAHLSSD
ncbi:hypothetical protein STEG23_012724, partial [Scotinomys teguina]